MCLNFLSRLVYLSYLEISVCATLTLSLCISRLDEIYASILLALLLMAIVSFFILYYKDATMHPAKTFEKRSSRIFCCWEVRWLRDGLEELTQEGMAKMYKYN